MQDLLIERFHRYFRHPDRRRDILTRGDRATACANLRDAFSYLDIAGERAWMSRSDEFDDELFQLVQKFQQRYNHPIVDGKVGPNTRRRIINALIQRHGPRVFDRLKRDPNESPTVFFSYAWADSDRVDKVDQWLRNHGIRVLRDRDVFVAGMTVDENIRSAIADADKIIAFYSAESKGRDWPQLERTIAEDVERRLDSRILIYISLDSTPLPKYDPNRLAINTSGILLSEVGQRILLSLTGQALEPRQIDIDENATI